MISSHAFARAWRRYHVFVSSSDADEFVALFWSVVIGQRNFFGIGFTIPS